MPPIISISNLTKTYASGLQALKSVDLEIRKGEIFALLGPNGAGKTTLISIVCGIVTPTEGVVVADGHDIVRDYRAARSKIGLVPQELTTDAFETVWATVSFSRGLFGHAPNPRAHREGAARSVVVGQAQRQDHDAVGRHEAAGDDRQGPVARAGDPVPGRADGGRRRGAAARHVGAGAGPARKRRDHHPDHPLHRRGRGDGRPDRGDQQGRADPGRGEDRADEEARQEAADAQSAGADGGDPRRAGRLAPGAERRGAASWNTPSTPTRSARASRRCSGG